MSHTIDFILKIKINLTLQIFFLNFNFELKLKTNKQVQKLLKKQLIRNYIQNLKERKVCFKCA